MEHPQPGRSTIARIGVAVVLGWAGAFVIWVVTPYNNNVLSNILISNTILPATAVFLVLVAVLGLNPLLRRLQPAWVLTRGQLAVIFATMLVSCGVIEFLRLVPFSLPRAVVQANANRELADAYARMDLPPELFPDRIGFGLPAPASEGFENEIRPEEPIPWDAWIKPLLAWSGLTIPSFMMMVGLGMIVFVQWRRNERLAFPLLTLQQAIIDVQPDRASVLPPMFRCKTFWIGVGIALGVHLLSGLSRYFPNKVPAIPTYFDLSRLFTDGVLIHTPDYIERHQLYFTFIGVAFFMPNRISFSVWFTAVAYAVYIVVCNGYFPPFRFGQVDDHRTGAMVALTLAVLWLGRAQWLRTFRAMFTVRPDGDGRRDRSAGWLFCLGCAGMWLWLVWVGVGPLGALGLTVAAFMVALVVSRLVAETGLPMINILVFHVTDLVRLAPLKLLGGPVLYVAGIIGVVFGHCGRALAAPLATHGVGLNEDAPPRRLAWLGWMFVAVLAVGMLVAGIGHVTAGYRRDSLLGGSRGPVPATWAPTNLGHSQGLLLQWHRGRMNDPVHNQTAHLLFGAGLALALQLACLAWPRWPLHPIGLIIVCTWAGNVMWFNVFLGWLAKKLVVGYGGSRLLVKAQPLFLGLILGEVFATVVWGIVPTILVMLDLPYHVVRVLPP